MAIKNLFVKKQPPLIPITVPPAGPWPGSLSDDESQAGERGGRREKQIRGSGFIAHTYVPPLQHHQYTIPTLIEASTQHPNTLYG